MADFFKEKLNCTNVPKQVADFYAKEDGRNLKINYIFSQKEILEQLDFFNKKFLNAGIEHDEDALYIPIANDGMGGYYAFIGNKPDENIYYLDAEFADEKPSVTSIAEILDLNEKLEAKDEC